MSLKLITIDNFHLEVPKYISDNEIILSEYNDVTELILKMLRNDYFFNMDLNLLRGYCEMLIYKYAPNDEKNKDRIVTMLEESDDESSDDEDDESADMTEMMMKMMMGQMANKNSSKGNVNVEDGNDDDNDDNDNNDDNDDNDDNDESEDLKEVN